MITVTESVPEFDTFHEILGYSPKSSLFFDIETTGFSPSSSVVFLIGVLFCEKDGSWTLRQFFAENTTDEPELLRAFLALAAHFDTLIHFNGSTFDLPYLRKKAEQYQLAHLPEFHAAFALLQNDSADHSDVSCRSLDLYQKYRSFGKILSLEHMNQISLEAFLGWQRKDRLTGKHMVTLFQKYAASKEPGILSLLLLHNHDDMIGMTKLLQFASYLALFDGTIGNLLSTELLTNDTSAENAVTGNRALTCDFSGNPSSGSGDSDLYTDTGGLPVILQIRFTPASPLPVSFSIDGTYRLTAEKDICTMQIPVVSETMCHFFPDYKNYYYLPLEDQAIHKSVAAYVDKQYRQPAKAANCYIKKSGRFLPQPEEVITPAFSRSYASPELYFSCDELFLSDQEQLKAYLCAVLRAMR
jgi:hypothetical protein